MKPIIRQAQPVSSFVDAAGSAFNKAEASGDGEVIPNDPGGFVYNAYHYIHFDIGNQTYGTATSAMDKAIAAAPSTVGVVVRRYWKDLESSSGVYTFSEITSLMSWCSTNNVQLSIMPITKTFQNGDGANNNPLPAYLASLAIANIDGAYTAPMWNATILARYNALINALAAHLQGLGTYAHFESISTQETAPSLGANALALHDYSPITLGDNMIAIFDNMATAFPNRRGWFWANFIPSANDPETGISIPGQPQITRIVTESWNANSNIILGGPDYLPVASNPLNDRFYPIMRSLKDTCPLFIRFSTPSYAVAGYTMSQLFTKCLTDIYPNIIISQYKVTSGQNFPNDMAPVIEAHPTFNIEVWT